MTLKEYIAGLMKFADENPDCGDMLVVTSSDDEGNGFNPVHYSPSKGYYEDREFSDDGSTDDVNAVCVN
jgi:hypothetical protein